MRITTLPTLLVAILSVQSIHTKYLFAQTIVPSDARQWLVRMKESARGPFQHIRWFCSDGRIVPAQQGCGTAPGRQHGEWSIETRTLRDAGYPVGTIYAELKEGDLEGIRSDPLALASLLLERFLILTDNGWVFQKARFYRGALQIDEEVAGSERLLHRLISDSTWRTDRYLLLREALRLLPGDRNDARYTEIRAMARQLATTNARFIPLRNKIHALPDESDAPAVRTFANSISLSHARAAYLKMADELDQANQVQPIDVVLTRLQPQLGHRELIQAINEAVHLLAHATDVRTRCQIYGEVLLDLRQGFDFETNPLVLRAMLAASIEIERALYLLSTPLIQVAPTRSRQEILNLVTAMVKAVYGTGLLSPRAYRAARGSLLRIGAGSAISLHQYRTEVLYLSSLSAWATRELQWSFLQSLNTLEPIEPKVREFIPDRLRTSLLLPLTELIRFLQCDANRLQGVSHRFFGKVVYVGLQPLNGGLARGTLTRMDSPTDLASHSSSQIVLVPEATSELPAVAGLLTMAQGNMLSHVQLLAHNLGIPNVVISPQLLPQLEQRLGRRIILVVTPAGRVHLQEGFEIPMSSPATALQVTPQLVEPDLDKLDLDSRQLIPLRELRSRDSGRTVGPKAANLGELRRRFPEAVADGIAIPFGTYSDVREQTMQQGISVRAWASAEYAQIQKSDSRSPYYAKRIQDMLFRIRNTILNTRFSAEFQRELYNALTTELGPDGSFGVFVRSDTNLEDLASFNGAGLNLTVPHVVGFQNILQAIREVWASPFTERAFSWRQAHLSNPLEVYVSVLLMKSVPVEKSGVLITTSTTEQDDGENFTAAIQEGVAGVVSDQSAETIEVQRETGTVRLLSEALSFDKRVLKPAGGMAHVPVTQRRQLMGQDELLQLYNIVDQLSGKFSFDGDDDAHVPLNIEFGFLNGKLFLFQIRPYATSKPGTLAQYYELVDRHDPAPVLGSVDLLQHPAVSGPEWQ